MTKKLTRDSSNDMLIKKIKPDDIEKIYKKAHDGIRKDPTKKRGDLEMGYFAAARKQPRAKDLTKKVWHKKAKSSKQQRANRIRQKLTSQIAQVKRQQAKAAH